MNRTILIAALIISGAILLNGYLDRAALPSRFSRPSASKVTKVVTDSLNETFQLHKGYIVLVNKKRDVKDIHINEIRYSEGGERMLIELILDCSDGEKVSWSIPLNRDDFGAYRGTTDIGAHKVYFQIK